MFKLKLEKVLERGEKKYRVLGWEGGIPEEKLPLPYLREGKRFVAHDKCIEIFGYNFNDPIYKNCVYTSLRNFNKYLRLSVGETYDVDLIEKVISMLKECGERLHHIRQEIKKLEQEWRGQIEVII